MSSKLKIPAKHNPSPTAAATLSAAITSALTESGAVIPVWNGTFYQNPLTGAVVTTIFFPLQGGQRYSLEYTNDGVNWSQATVLEPEQDSVHSVTLDFTSGIGWRVMRQ